MVKKNRNNNNSFNWFNGNAVKSKSKKPLFKPVTLYNSKASVKNIKKKDLTWPQAQQRYPRMNPNGDADRDGKINMFDCRPFDKKRHGFQHQYSFSSVASKKIQTVKMPPELFLKTTYGEARRNTMRYAKTKEEGNKMVEENLGGYGRYKDDLTYGAGGVTHKYKYSGYVGGEPVMYPAMKKETGIKKRIEGKDKYGKHVPVPMLEFDEDGNQKGHEGRHTALTAQRMGLQYIPVTIERPKVTQLTSKYERLEPIEKKQFQDWKYNEKTGMMNDAPIITTEDLQSKQEVMTEQPESLKHIEPEQEQQDNFEVAERRRLEQERTEAIKEATKAKEQNKQYQKQLEESQQYQQQLEQQQQMIQQAQMQQQQMQPPARLENPKVVLTKNPDMDGYQDTIEEAREVYLYDKD